MKIGLGTAQFGMDYGISNGAGKIPITEVREILDLAGCENISVIDTASVYGNSEEVIGNNLPKNSDFSIVTKTPIFTNKSIAQKDVVTLKDTFLCSLKNLKQASIYGLLIHAPDDLLKKGGNALWDTMYDLKNQGLVKKIGISVYNGEQIDRILENFLPDLIQLPLNVFDQRLLHSGHLTKLKKMGVEIHARSVFLQGALLSKVGMLPECVKGMRSYLQRYYQFVFKNRWTPIQAALGFVLGIKEVDVAFVGVDSCSHLQDIINFAKPLDNDLFFPFIIDEDTVLNPSKWKL